jgi:choline dehydrogenase-like flavoprotein
MLTFESLSRAKKSELDKLMKISPAPTMDEVLGDEFRGWNLNASTRLTGTRKFHKGFFGTSGLDHIWGYNMPTQQNDFDQPWMTTPSDDNPKRYFFFKVFPGDSKWLYPKSLVIDYQSSREYFPLNPIGYTVDYLVYPDPANHDLILGKSYIEVGPIKLFLGYFVVERRRKADYPRKSHFFIERELRTVHAFAEAFVDGNKAVLTAREIAFNVDLQLARMKTNRVQSLKLVLFLLEYVLPRFPMPFHKSFSNKTVAGRKDFITKRLASTRTSGALRDLSRIRTLFAAGYYTDERTYPRIHFEKVEERPVRKDHLVLLPREGVTITNPPAELDCDVCVIGSGAGGAVVAQRLQQSGKRVVLVEEGRYFPPDQINNRESEMTARMYKEGGLQTTVDLDMVILQGKCLGGSTVINNAICFRLNDPDLTPGGRNVLADWDKLGANIDQARLSESFVRVEHDLNVRPLLQTQDPAVPRIDGPNADALLRGWDDVQRRDASLEQYRADLFKKNYFRCLGCGYCNFGCRWGRKMSMAETYIPAAQKAGAVIVTECHAKGIEIENGAARAVHCERPGGGTLRVRAKAVVVACGAIGSSVLLMKSGVKRNVGERFSFNLGTPVFARFDQPQRSFDGVQMAAYIDFRDFLLESLFYPPVGFAAALPGWFDVHFGRMNTYDHFACAGVLIGTDHNFRVKRTALFRKWFGPINGSLNKPDLQRMRRGMARLAEIYFAAGANTVIPATFGDVVLRSSEHGRSSAQKIEEYLAEHIRKPEDLTLSSAHPQGGNAMSDSTSIGVVDSKFRVHGTRNVYVCDASVFPTTIAVNPQLTIMAMADYFAEQMTV